MPATVFEYPAQEIGQQKKVCHKVVGIKRNAYDMASLALQTMGGYTVSA